MNSHSFTLIEHVDVSLLPRKEFEELLVVASSKIKMHIIDMLASSVRHDGSKLTIVYNNTKIVGASLYRVKNKNTQNSTTVLYNLFSMEPGAGSIAFQSYWDFAFNHSRWFKFFVSKNAHSFYQKYSVKYWGASKTGETFSSLGLILSPKPKQSMLEWNSIVMSNNIISSVDRIYLESNLAVFNSKHKVGILKLKTPHLQNLLENMLQYENSSISLDF